MFDTLSLHGGGASILWGARVAAEFTKWRIVKQALGKGKYRWVLMAKAARVDAFQIRQHPLLFTAPRKGGFWAWPVESLRVEPNRVVGHLGQPEQ